MTKYQHARVTSFTPQEDGTLLVETEGYFEELNSVKQEIRQNFNTTQETLMTDVIRALEVFTMGDSPEITLKIVKHKGQPQRIVRTHTVYKKKV